MKPHSERSLKELLSLRSRIMQAIELKCPAEAHELRAIDALIDQYGQPSAGPYSTIYTPAAAVRRVLETAGVAMSKDEIVDTAIQGGYGTADEHRDRHLRQSIDHAKRTGNLVAGPDGKLSLA